MSLILPDGVCNADVISLLLLIYSVDLRVSACVFVFAYMCGRQDLPYYSCAGTGLPSKPQVQVFAYHNLNKRNITINL